jgi:sulfoxide reductase heme-binding subunit YedZ
MNRLLSRSWVKPALFILSCVPLARLAFGFYKNDLGANPVEFLEHSTGDWAIRLILVTLSITPLRKVAGLPALARFRRMLGLFAFFYAFLHFFVYLFFDQQFDLMGILADIGKRRFITVGFLAWVCLATLATTSTAGWINRMGVRRWQKLHKLVYLSGVAAVFHYYWLVKSDIRLPVLYGAILAVLFIARTPWL